MEASMEQDEAKKFISGVYKYLLGRVPGDGEFSHWISEAQSGRPPSDLLRLFGEGLELKQKNRIKTEYYSGHFHSPIVDPEQVVDYVRSNRTSDLGGIKGVNLSMDSMIEFWTDFEAEVPSIPFTSEKRFGRYYYENGFFPPGDAIALYAHFIKYRPQRVIEIGSGFSSACMLDIAGNCSPPWRRVMPPLDLRISNSRLDTITAASIHRIRGSTIPPRPLQG
jgi:hypothetical protein